MRVLALNCGSSTLKFDVVDVLPNADQPPAPVACGIIDRVGGEGVARLSAGDVAATRVHHASDHDEAFSIAAQMLEEAGLAEGIEAVGHRVVHGGERFREQVLIDDAVIEGIEAASELAPLHNAPALAAIAASRRHFGATMPMAATFDTTFFAELPDVAVQYAVPRNLVERLGIRRYGFHGLAHRCMVERFRSLHPDIENARLITLQLGNGCSATASAGGRAIDTSMGFTPLEGMIMGTRSGDVDPSIHLYLAKKLGASPEEVEAVLNNESGLLGLSGKSNDMRDLLELSRSGDPAADLAVRTFCYRAPQVHRRLPSGPRRRGCCHLRRRHRRAPAGDSGSDLRRAQVGGAANRCRGESDSRRGRVPHQPARLAGASVHHPGTGIDRHRRGHVRLSITQPVRTHAIP